MFDEDLNRVRRFYLDLLNLQLPQLSFEEKFHVLELNFPLEELLEEQRRSEAAAFYYCFFVHPHRGIRYALINDAESALALKIKRGEPLSREEKDAALRLLRRLE